MDSYVSSWSVFVMAATESVLFGWVYGKRKAEACGVCHCDIEMPGTHVFLLLLFGWDFKAKCPAGSIRVSFGHIDWISWKSFDSCHCGGGRGIIIHFSKVRKRYIGVTRWLLVCFKEFAERITCTVWSTTVKFSSKANCWLVCLHNYKHLCMNMYVVFWVDI